MIADTTYSLIFYDSIGHSGGIAAKAFDHGELPSFLSYFILGTNVSKSTISSVRLVKLWKRALAKKAV